MNVKLVIFDMDGTLVQSEDCSSQAILDVVPKLTASRKELSARYRGMRLADVFQDIAREHPNSVPDNWLELYREREECLSSSMIKASPGADRLLSQLTRPKCIASNASGEKTRRSLEICSLSQHFGTGIFSGSDIEAWKPDPALFLHAAANLQVAPADCIVLEDSDVGIKAAQAANMKVIQYAPFGETIIDDRIPCITSLMELLDFVS